MPEFNTRKNLKLFISDYQMEIIIGSILGDAYIHKLGKIQFENSINQYEYLLWKYDNLKNLAYGEPSFVTRFDKRYLKYNKSSRFWLRQYFRSLRQDFYPNGKKVFSEKYSKYFNELALAVWYMDDGNLYDRKVIKISSDGFDYESKSKLVDILSTKFKILSSIQNKSGKIRISNKSVKRFIEIVRPFIHSSMAYKICLTP